MRFLGQTLLLVALAIGSGGVARAQGKTFELLADPDLVATGVLKFMVPRFALKYQIRPTIVTEPTGAEAMVFGVPDVAGPGAKVIFHRPEATPPEIYAAGLRPDAEGADFAATFREWLLSDVGRATLATFKVDEEVAFLPGRPETERVEITREAPGDAGEGEKVAMFHCGRCHVVSEKNRMGGIGSTPSFRALRAIPDWEDKFLAFWSANPHPSFTQVEGITEPFDPARPPHIAPVEITLEDIEAIVAYAGSLEPKDLGAPVK
jgi:hypothetical protein